MDIRHFRVAGVLVLIAIEALLYGYTYPYFALVLEARGLPAWLIGLNASVAGAGILLVGPFLPRLINRIGLRVVVTCQFALSLVCFAVMLTTNDVAVWFVVRFVMGTAFASLWTTTEIWLNDVVSDAARGKIIGASGTLYATFQFLGPLSLSQVGVDGAIPIYAAMLPLAIAVVVAICVRSDAVADQDGMSEDTTIGIAGAFPLAMALMAAAFVTGSGETAMQGLLPVWALNQNYGVAASASLVSVFSLGEVVLVAVLGWCADKFGRRRVLVATSLVAFLSCAAMPLAAAAWITLVPTTFVAGGTVAGLYTLGVVLIGHDYRGKALATVSAGFAMSYAAGSVVGATLFGVVMNIFGSNALPIGIGVTFLCLALFVSRGGPTSQ